MTNIGEFYIVAFDFADDDVPTLAVAKSGGVDVELVNLIHGDEAVALYERLIKKKNN